MDRGIVVKRWLMPAAHPIELRERALRAYLEGNESMMVVAARFDVRSPIDPVCLDTVVTTLGDATTHELTVAYNQRVPRSLRVHRSSIQRALRRRGYVFKKNG